MADAIVRPFLLFQGNAEAAINSYVSLFEDGQILELTRYSTNEPGTEGSVKRARFIVGGQSLFATDSIVKQGFAFTPAMSLFVECGSEEQIHKLAAALSQDGTTFMPLGSYGFSRKFAWVSDQFGVSWQLNLT